MNITPRAIRPLEIAALRALGGAEELGASIDLKANTSATLAAVVYDLFGQPPDPGATPPVPGIPGKQALYAEAKARHGAARAALRVALAEGRAFAMQAVNTLKGLLGNRWNARWDGVGFSSGSLQLPKNALPILTMLGAYYRAHSEHEAPAWNLTSARAEEVKAALVDARRAVDAERIAETLAKQARDAAFKKLRMRIKGLRDELRCLLSPDDARWYGFGFRRPVDGTMADAIEELNLRPAGPGEVIAKWPPARLAANYRVSWKVAESNAEPTEVGIFTEPQAVIAELPPATPITVFVTARNRAGESAAVEARIVVPEIIEPETPGTLSEALTEPISSPPNPSDHSLV